MVKIDRRRLQHGFTLMEAVMTLAIFGIFIFIFVTLTAEMRGYDKRYPVNFMKHPQVTAVLSRMRRDVWDATLYKSLDESGEMVDTPMYPEDVDDYSQSDKTLIVYSIQASGFAQTVVWDFSVPGEARRLSYNVGVVVSDWRARGLPGTFTIGTYEIPNRPYAVRMKAFDGAGTLAIDQIFQPRSH